MLSIVGQGLIYQSLHSLVFPTVTFTDGAPYSIQGYPTMLVQFYRAARASIKSSSSLAHSSFSAARGHPNIG